MKLSAIFCILIIARIHSTYADTETETLNSDKKILIDGVLDEDGFIPGLIESLFHNVSELYKTDAESVKMLKLKQVTPKKLITATHGGSFQSYELNKLADIQMEVVRKLSAKLENYMSSQQISDLLKATHLPENFCPYNAKIDCHPYLNYRSFDGTCNNLKYPLAGAANTPYKRWLTPEYKDGWGALRDTVVINGEHYPLTNPREIVLNCHQPNDLTSKLSSAWIWFGQFVDHDIINTAPTIDEHGDPVRCRCGDTAEYCSNMRVPENDIWAGTQKCYAFTRAGGSINFKDCHFSHREQVGTVTQYVDLSGVYGQNAHDAKKLRKGEYGLMRTSHCNETETLPYLNESFAHDGCASFAERRGFDCYDNTPDGRNQDNHFLIIFHTLFTLQHNDIARGLLHFNPQCKYDDETLYQEARRINIAIYQKIVFRDMLKILVGPAALYRYGLIHPKDGDYFYGYNPNLAAGVYDSIVCAAFRYGHAVIPSEIIKPDEYCVPVETEKMENVLFHAGEYCKEDAQNVYSRSMICDGANVMSPHVTHHYSNQLFRGFFGPSHGSLPAANNQRCRDFGVPSYVKFRKYCGLSVPKNFDELYDMKKSTVEKLKKVYKYVEHIDLFTAGLAEISMRQYNFKGGFVGPTFACLLTLQFKELREGDRFYYETKTEYGNPFTREQVAEINRMTLSHFFAPHIRVHAIQPDLFWRSNNEWNKPIPRDEYNKRQIDLSLWKLNCPARGYTKSGF